MLGNLHRWYIHFVKSGMWMLNQFYGLKSLSLLDYEFVNFVVIYYKRNIIFSLRFHRNEIIIRNEVETIIVMD